jgi:hypothetical protein
LIKDETGKEGRARLSFPVGKSLHKINAQAKIEAIFKANLASQEPG